MMTILFGVHVVICVLLIIIILIQAGRGGGLVEGFSGVESMFGPKTSSFLTRATSIFSVLFFISCISLALLSARQSRSLLKSVKEEKSTQTSPVQSSAKTQKETQQPAAADSQAKEVKKEEVAAEKQKEPEAVKSESAKQEPVEKK